MNFQEKIRQLIVGDNLIIVFVITENVGDDITNLVLVFLHQCMQNLYYFTFLKLLVIVGIKLC
jgi:hypothetical protein